MPPSAERTPPSAERDPPSTTQLVTPAKMAMGIVNDARCLMKTSSVE
jgi:hypothetical protein